MRGGAFAAALALLLGAGVVNAAVPRPFEPLRVRPLASAVEVELWGRSYRFDAGPLPATIEAQGRSLFAERPRFRLGGDAEVAWLPVALVEARPELVRLRSVGTADGLRVEAETRIEYDGMIAVDIALHAERRLRVERFAYQLRLPSDALRFFARHLPYDYQAANVDKRRLLEAAGLLPERLALDFVPTLALGDRRAGIEWWSETNVHWREAPGGHPFTVVRRGALTELRVTPIGAPLPLEAGAVWRDAFALFVLPARPPPERWRAVRFLPYPRAAGFDSRVGTRFLSLAMGEGFHARWDGLPAAEPDAYQQRVRAEHARYGVGYMPYGMLTLAPLLHPRTMAEFASWSAEGRWWRLQPGFDNAVIRRTHPELGPGAPYTYPACAGRADYFDFMLAENLAALASERLDALYFDHGAITRMCTKSPVLAGRPRREVWEYRNVREFYKRLYEGVAAQRPEALVVIHSHGAPKALGAFVDFHMFGEALNAVFGGGHSVAAYRADPSLYTPDYLALPEGWLDAQRFPPAGGVASVLPQIKWAVDPTQPARARGFQRAFLALILVDDAHAPLWVSDLDSAEEVYRAVDRFGDLGAAVAYPWWVNEAAVARPAGLRATAFVRDGRALLVLANLSGADIEGEVRVDAAALGLGDSLRVRDLERVEVRAEPAAGGRFSVMVPARDLRLMLLAPAGAP